MADRSITDLQEALRLGLSVVSEKWNYKAKKWVTSVYAADIDNDGDIEILVGSRDGRVCALTKQGDCRWNRIVGDKAWVGTVMGVPLVEARDNRARIFAGTRDGKVYALDQDGQTVSKDGKVFAFDKDGKAIDEEKEQAAFWYSTDYVIRQIYADPKKPSDIVFGSEDRHAYALDYQTGEVRWKFATGGWIHAVFACDINGDGQVETLVGSGDNYLYILNSKGQEINKRNIGNSVHTIFAADVDNDGEIEILVGTGTKDFLALTSDLEEKWRHRFENRFHSLHVADIDHDGHYEIIAGSEDKHIYFLDPQGEIIWRHNLGYRVLSVYALDIDNDGFVEVLVGSDDSRVHALRVNLERGLYRRIRRYCETRKRSLSTMLNELSVDEQALVRDILKEDVTQKHHVTVKTVEKQIDKKHYHLALSGLFKLEQDKVQKLWHKDSTSRIRTLCFGNICGDTKREIIIGTTEGNIQIFNVHGRTLGTLALGSYILGLQTGYIDGGRWAEILTCSNDHQVRVVSGVGDMKQLQSSLVEKQHAYIDEWLSCIWVQAERKQTPAEIIVGSENKKIYIYGRDLDTPINVIETPQGINTICAHNSQESDTPEIIAGSIDDTVYAYTRSGTQLWEYKIHNRVLDICIKDIDGDGKDEIIVGSEDRNVHVLDSKGHLKWRYYLPHRTFVVDAVDVDGDGKIEVLVGCGDGYMYVFSKEGDILWKYKSNDRICVVRAEDINDDNNVEIVVGSEDQLELLQVVNQQKLQPLINTCWAALQQGKTSSDLIDELMHSTDPVLRAFALNKFAEQADLTPQKLSDFEPFVKDDSIEVRKVLIRTVMARCSVDPQKARQLLNQLSMDDDEDVRSAFIEHLPTLMKSNWELGFQYLESFSRNIDRFVRRAVIRKLHQLIDDHRQQADNRIFNLLVKAAQDEGSTWIRQEAARTLAHFLDFKYEFIIIYISIFTIKNIHPSIVKYMADSSRMPIVRRGIHTLVPLLTDLDTTNVLERIEQAVKGLEEAKSLKYGKDAWLIYGEFRRLFNMGTISDIAQYQCSLTAGQFSPTNKHAHMVLPLLSKLSSITRLLKIYLRRASINDRLSSLLEAINAIDKMSKLVDHDYAMPLRDGVLVGESMANLPDRHFFDLLLKSWKDVVEAQFDELRGKAELEATLRTKCAHQEEQVGVLLSVSNKGRSSADEVKVTLLHSHNFDVVSQRSFETETVFPGEEVPFEFIIRPHTTSLDLIFEIYYNDVDMTEQTLSLRDRLELQPSLSAFKWISNPYSTGTPTHGSEMFYGRDDDIKFLKDNLTRSPAKTVIVLHGLRRSGKTTLLLHLVNTSVLEPHIPVFIDMQHESYHISISKFFYKVAFYIFQALRQKGILICQPAIKDFEVDPTFTFDLFLNGVEAQLNGEKIIMLIDEFEVLEEQVKKGNLQPEFFEYLRSLMQHRQSLNFLLSGTHKIEQLTKGYWSVFFNIALHYRLSKLSEMGATDLISKPVEGYLEYDPYALAKIRRLTGDQPYLIHLMCRSLVDYCNEKRKAYVTINDVNTVLHEVMQTGQFHFGWLWDQITQHERVVLAVIVEGGKDEGRLLSLVEIEDIFRYYRYPYKHDLVLESLTSLKNLDVIESVSDDGRESVFDGTRYRIAVGLIRRWLQRKAAGVCDARCEISR